MQITAIMHVSRELQYAYSVAAKPKTTFEGDCLSSVNFILAYSVDVSILTQIMSEKAEALRHKVEYMMCM